MIRPALVAALLAAASFASFIAPPVAAQLPANTDYLLLVGNGQLPAELYGYDANGRLTTIEPLPGSIVTARMDVAPGRGDVLIWGQMLGGCGFHRYDRATGAFTSTSLGGVGCGNYGFLDDDGGMVYGDANGRAAKAADLAQSVVTPLRSAANVTFTVAGLNVSTGRYVFETIGIRPTPSRLEVLDRSGATARSFGAAGLIDIEWDPWSDALWLLRQSTSNQLLSMANERSITTVQSLPIVATPPQALAVDHQPAPRLLIAELGRVVAWTPGGGTTTFASTPGYVYDVVNVRGKTLWPADVWRAGLGGSLALDFGPAHAGDHYQVALSFASTPGISVPGVGRIHLAFDALFLASLNAGFVGFAGTLDANGRPQNTPTVAIGGSLVGLGLRVFAAAVAYDANGITVISNACGTTIR